MENENQPTTDLTSVFEKLFESSSGEEELLRIASKYSRQISAYQIRAILFLEWSATYCTGELKQRLREIIDKWLELKQFNNSALFVMRALESIALKKFIGQDAMKFNIQK